MKKLYLLLGLIVVYSFLAVAMNHRISKEKLEGKWNVKIAEAPYGYRDIVVEIKGDKGVYSADILFVDSKSKISDQMLTMKDGKLAGSVFVDNKNVGISVWEEKGVVKGTAIGPIMGSMSMTFARPKD